MIKFSSVQVEGSTIIGKMGFRKWEIKFEEISQFRLENVLSLYDEIGLTIEAGQVHFLTDATSNFMEIASALSFSSVFGDDWYARVGDGEILECKLKSALERSVGALRVVLSGSLEATMPDKFDRHLREVDRLHREGAEISQFEKCNIGDEFRKVLKSESVVIRVDDDIDYIVRLCGGGLMMEEIHQFFDLMEAVELLTAYGFECADNKLDEMKENVRALIEIQRSDLRAVGDDLMNEHNAQQWIFEAIGFGSRTNFKWRRPRKR